MPRQPTGDSDNSPMLFLQVSLPDWKQLLCTITLWWAGAVSAADLS